MASPRPNPHYATRAIEHAERSAIVRLRAAKCRAELIRRRTVTAFESKTLQGTFVVGGLGDISLAIPRRGAPIDFRRAPIIAQRTSPDGSWLLSNPDTTALWFETLDEALDAMSRDIPS